MKLEKHPSSSRFGRLALIALLLAVAVTGMVQPREARSAPHAQAMIRYSLEIVNKTVTLCVGETLSYEILVLQHWLEAPPGWADKIKLPEPTALWFVKIDPHSTDTSVGDFEDKKPAITTAIIDDGYWGPPTAHFRFTAKKPGNTTLYFEGMVKGYDIHLDYVSDSLHIKVMDCIYNVNTNSLWVYTTPAGTAFANAFIYDALLETIVDPEEGNFRAENVPVKWVVVEHIPNYGSTVSIHDGTATITAKALDETLKVNIEFNSVSGAETICGAPGCGGGPLTLAADPVSYLTTVAGGASPPISNKLTGNGKAVQGRTYVTVTPVETSK